MILKTLRPVSVVALMLAAPTLASAEPWSFTDSSGKTVALDEIPTRIIAHQDAAAGLIPLGIRPVGIYADSPVADAKALQGLDLSGIEIIGQAWGEVDIEKAAALEPDLIIAEYWPVSKEWSGGNDLTGPQSPFASLAEITGVTVGESIIGIVEDYEELAASLGAAPSEAATSDKAKFEAARDAFIAANEGQAQPDRSGRVGRRRCPLRRHPGRQLRIDGFPQLGARRHHPRQYRRARLL
jgi:iron complex transport system substrate-binding protein